MNSKKLNIALSVVLVVIVLVGAFLFFTKDGSDVSNVAETSESTGVPYNYEGFKEPSLEPARPTTSSVDSSEAAESTEEYIPTLYLPANASEESITLTMCNVSRMGQKTEQQKNIDSMKDFVLNDLAQRVDNPSNPDLKKVKEAAISSDGDFDEIVGACNG